MSIRTDSNRNPTAVANIASDVITLNNYQVSSNLYAVAPNATHTFQSMSQSNVNVSQLLQNERFQTSGFKSGDATVSKANVSGSGNAIVVNQLIGKELSLQQSIDLQNGLLGNVNQAQLRNLSTSTYLYGNSYTLPSITLGTGSGTFAKNIDITSSLQSNVLTNSELSATQLENSERVTTKDGNVTNNMTLSNMYATGAKIENNAVTFTNAVDMNGATSITSLRNSTLNVQNQTTSGAISQMAGTTTVSYITPTESTFAGTCGVSDSTTTGNAIVRRFGEVVNGIFQSNLDVTTLYATVDGISQLSSNLVNVSDTLYVSTQYNHTKNDINTNGNLITTTNSVIAPNVNITGTANITRRVFNSDTVAANAVYPDTLFINQSAKAGNLNTGALQAGSYNALRRITTTGNVESNVVVANGLRGSGEFIFNSQVDVNTLQAMDLNLNNTTISFLSSNSAGANIDFANLNSYITSNVITGYTTANIISANVVQDIVVGNVLANVKVGEVVTGNIYLGNILTEIIVSNTSANLIVGNISTFVTIGNTVANVVVGNISSNVFIGNLEVISIVGNVSSNVITGNITSNVIVGYQESNVIVGNIESQVVVGQTSSQVITGYIVENVITGNTTANVIVGTYDEEVLIGNTIANVVVGNVTANVISGYELANVVIGNVYANIVVGNVLANIVVGNVLGNIVIGNIEQTVVVGNIEGNGIVGNVYANIVVGNIEQSNVLVGNTVVPNVVIGNVITENVVIGNIVTTGIVGNTIITGVNGNTVTANVLSGNLVLSSVAITPISVPSIWSDLIGGNLNGNILTSKTVGNVSLPFTESPVYGNIAQSTFYPAFNNSQQLVSVSWSPTLNLFAATAMTGSGNRFLTSPDGINWTNRTSTAESNWYGSCWASGLGLFVAVGGSCCATSPDGINWTARSIPSGEWFDVCWSQERSLLVAVAWSAASTNLAVMTSPDGITWTARTTPNNYQWQSVTWSPSLNLFVAVAGGGIDGVGINDNVMTSPDGITWTLRTTNYQKRWYGVSWSPTLGMLVAVARSWSTSSVMYSMDGINWSLGSNPNCGYNHVIWASELSMFIAATSWGASPAHFSKDGINWYSMTTRNQNDNYGLAWAPSIGTLCIVNNSSTNKVEYATVSITAPSNSGNSSVLSNVLIGNIFSSNILIGNILTENVVIGNTTANVVVGNTSVYGIIGNIVTYGITGNITSNVSANVYDPSNVSDNANVSVFTYTAPPSNVNRRSICWSSELLQFVAVASSGTTASIISSTNGTTWTARTAPNTNNLTSVCWSPELSLYCAVASSGTGNRVITSPDGITWTARTSAANHTWNSICWSPELNMFVAVSNQTSASVMTSSNGSTWMLAAGVPSINNLTSVCWSSQLGIFVAVSSTGSVITSSNGSIWTQYNGASSNAWQSVCWAPELSLFVAVSSSGTGDRVMTSPDGTSWTSRTSAADYAWSSIAWANDIKRFYVVSEDTNNFMMTSTDAITWTLIGTSTFNTRSSICWAPEIGEICAVSSLTTTSNRIVTHTNSIFSDGRSFTLSSANGFNILNNMNAYEWSGNLMVGVGSGTSNVIVTSGNMVTWTDRTTTNSSIYSQNWTSLAWSQELGIYCAISSSGTGYRVMISTDGNTWTPVATPADNNWTSVIWAKELGLFVAVASSGTGNRVMTSPNGTTWTLRTSAADNNWTSVAWAPSLNLLCAIGKPVLFVDNGNKFYIDPNYLYQENNTTITANNNILSVDGNPGKYYTSGGYLNKPYFDFTSTTVNSMVDFVRFSNSGTSLNMSLNNGFTYIGQIYISSSSPSTVVDIINMTNSTDPATIGNMINLSYDTSTNKFNFTAYSSSTLVINQTSTNTYSMNQWYRITIAVSNVTGNLNSMMYINNVLDNTTTFTTKLGNPLLDKTTIGTSYQNVSRRFVGKLDSFFVYDRLLTNTQIQNMYNYIDNGEDLSMKSSDGITWNFNKNIKSATSVDNSYIYNNWTSIAWSPSLSLFCAVASTGTYNRIATSPDGITWTTHNTNYNDFAWNSVIWSPEISKFYITSTGSALDNVIATSSDGINWLLTYPPTDVSYSWNSLAWSPTLGELYGVGRNSNGNISTIMSTNSMLSGNTYIGDDLSGNISSFSATNGFYTTIFATASIVWSPKLKLFCAVGNGGNVTAGTTPIVTSPNGINWTTRTISAVGGQEFSSICWSAPRQQFVAIGYYSSVSSYVARSTDGITWSVTASPATNNWSSVCWSDELAIFVAVARTGTANRVMTSTNGSTWTIRSTSGKDYTWESVCWSPQLGIFVAVAGMNLRANSNDCVMTSPDGINWTLRTSPVNIWQSVCWSPELSLFVAVGNDASSTNAAYYNYLVMTSPDGINWTSRDTSAFGNISWNTIIWVKELGRFLISGSDSGSLLTSTDGINWTTITYDSATTKGYLAISWAPEIGQICAVAGSNANWSNKVLTFSSPVLHNYRNFTIADTINKLGNINAISWSPSLNEFVGIGNGTVNLIQDQYANVDGSSLVTTTTGAYLSNNWKSVAYSSSLNIYVAVASSGTGNRIMTSSDGTMWIARTSPADNNWEKVIWATELGLFVAVASSGTSNRIMTSPNGITWTLRTTSNNNWKSVAWAPTIPLLCAVGTLLYTKPTALYNTTNNKIAAIANDMTPLADGTAVTSFGSYALSTFSSPLIQYYSSGGYKNKPFIQFKGVTPGQDILNISSLALNMSTNGGFTLVTKVYIAEGRETRTRYPIWQTNNALNYGTNLIGLYYFTPSQVGSSNGYFSFQIYNGGTSSSSGTLICTANTTSTFALNNWYTITVTVASANGSAAEIYVDGVLAGSANISAALTNRTNIYNYIGQDTANAQFRFLGLYDSVFVYDRLLNSTELQTVYDYIEGTSGDNNSVITSPDGVTWTPRSTNFDSNNISSITWSPKLSMFVAVGNNHLGNRIIRSSNGTSWTPCKVNYDYQNWKTVVWVEDLGLFYATTSENSYDNAILTSTDGIEWLLTYPPTDARYSWKNFAWAQSLNKLYCFGEDVNGNAAILSHTNAISFATSNVNVTTPVYGNILVPEYGNILTPVYGNVEVPLYGNVDTPIYGNVITSLYGNIIIPKYTESNTEVFGNLRIPTLTQNTSNISITGNVISSNFNLTIPLYADLLTPTYGNVISPIYGNVIVPEYGNIITPVYGNLLIPEYATVIEPIYANVLVPVYGNILIPVYGNVITPVYGQAYIPVYGEVLVPQYGNVLVPEYGFVQLPIYEEVTTPVYGNVIVPVYETQQFPIYEEQTVPIYTAIPTPIYSTVVEDVYETVYTPIYQVSNVAIYETVVTPIYTEFITPIYGTIYLPQYEEILTPIIEERVTPIYQEVVTPIYQETIIPITTYVYTPIYQDIVEPIYEDVLQPVYGKALLPVYTEVQIPIYSEVLVYMDPTAKTSSSKDIFTGSATVTNLLSFANGTVNNLFSIDSLYAPNLSLMSNHTPLGTGNMVVGNINAGNLVVYPNYGAKTSISTERYISSFRNTTLSGQLVVGNIYVNRNYISFNSNQELKPGNIDVGQTLFATGLSVQTSNTTIQNISTLNGDAMIHISNGVSESNIRDNRIYTDYVSSNNSVSLSSISVSGEATTKNVNVSNDASISGNIYANNGMMSSNLNAEYVIATDNMFISSNVSGTFTMPRTEAGNLTIKDSVRSNNIKSSSLQDILDLHGNISSSTLYQSIDNLRTVLNKDANDHLYLGSNVLGNIYIGGPGAVAQTIYIGSALDTIYIGGDLSNIFTTDTNVKDATIIINHGGTSYENAGVEFEESAVVKGSLLLNSSGQFIFTDATGNVYSLTYIADGNFQNMSVNGTILGTKNMSSNVMTVQQSLNSSTEINTNLFENSGNASAQNVNVSGEVSTSTLSTLSLMESTQLTVSGNTTLTGNVLVSYDTSASSLTTQSMESGNMTVSSTLATQNMAFTTYNGTNATISNLSNIQSINTHSIELHGGNLTTTNTLITKDIELNSSNITTRDSIYEFRVKGTTHFGLNGTYDQNNFGVMNITTGNTNPEPSLSIVRENNYVWNMGYDNNSNDFVIYDGNVGVRLTAENSQSWSSVSDARYKKNIESIDVKSAMEQVMKGRGVYYNYLSDPEDAKPKIGFIAQELREILPEVVDVPEDEEAMLTVRYQEVTALLIQALKGASQEVKELKAQIQSIKEERKSQA